MGGIVERGKKSRLPLLGLLLVAANVPLLQDGREDVEVLSPGGLGKAKDCEGENA